VTRALDSGGHSHGVYSNGARFQQAMVRETFDVLILDWMMPDITGLEVLDWLRKLENHTAVLFLTSPDAEEDIVQALAHGADDYLVKPAAMVRPLPQFAASARLGHAQALVDKDGVTRRYLAQEQGDGKAYDHLALSLLAAGTSTAGAGRSEAASARLVPFAGPAGDFTRIPIADVRDGRVDPGRLRGATVLLGATATGLGDTVVTPLAGINGAMPGVEFVANVLDAERQGLVRHTVSVPVQMGTGAAIVLLYLISLLLLSPHRALVLTVLLAAGLPVLAWTVMIRAGWWWPNAAVLLTVLLAYPLWSWRRLEASLVTMTRETERMAGMLHAGARVLDGSHGPHVLDPVENRIAAITQAGDEVADPLAVGGDAEQSAQVRDDMMRHLAHDLRSPLVSLRALADQLRGGSPADQAAMLARVDACARRSLDLTEQFLLIGRAPSLDSTRFAEVDLVQLLHDCADDLWEDAQTHRARVVRRCSLDLALVMGDARLLRRAMLNLGWNALRHGPHAGLVTVSLQAIDDSYLLAVHDQGAGFDAADLTALSQRYASGKAARRQGGKAAGKGHGLGLALVQLVAEKHSAQVVVDHPAEGGFTLGLQLQAIPQP
jgi:signal transduction histidine kinase